MSIDSRYGYIYSFLGFEHLNPYRIEKNDFGMLLYRPYGPFFGVPLKTPKNIIPTKVYNGTSIDTPNTTVQNFLFLHHCAMI